MCLTQQQRTFDVVVNLKHALQIHNNVSSTCLMCELCAYFFRFRVFRHERSLYLLYLLIIGNIYYIHYPITYNYCRV